MPETNRPPSARALRVLRDARRHIENGWCQRAHARKADGSVCDPLARDAAAWCLSGAVLAGGGDLGDTAYYYIEKAIGGETGINHWNDVDCHSQSVALALLDRAIALAEGNAARSAAPPQESVAEGQGDDGDAE